MDMTADEKAAWLLESMRPTDETEWSMLTAMLRFLKDLNERAQRDLGLARAVDLATEACRSIGLNWDMNRFLENLPSESRRYFDAMGEAVEIYASIHRTGAPEADLAELRRIREICLDPIGGGRY